MSPVCACMGCPNNRPRASKSAPIHKFPFNQIGEKWVNFVRRTRPDWSFTSIESLRLLKDPNYYGLCSLHFTDDCQDPDPHVKFQIASGLFPKLRPRLLPGAVPTIYPEVGHKDNQRSKTKREAVVKKLDKTRIKRKLLSELKDLKKQLQSGKSTTVTEEDGSSSISPKDGVSHSSQLMVIDTEELPPWDFTLPTKTLETENIIPRRTEQPSTSCPVQEPPPARTICLQSVKSDFLHPHASGKDCDFFPVFVAPPVGAQLGTNHIAHSSGNSLLKSSSEADVAVQGRKLCDMSSATKVSDRSTVDINLENSSANEPALPSIFAKHEFVEFGSVTVENITHVSNVAGENIINPVPSPIESSVPSCESNSSATREDSIVSAANCTPAKQVIGIPNGNNVNVGSETDQEKTSEHDDPKPVATKEMCPKSAGETTHIISNRSEGKSDNIGKGVGQKLVTQVHDASSVSALNAQAKGPIRLTGDGNNESCDTSTVCSEVCPISGCVVNDGEEGNAGLCNLNSTKTNKAGDTGSSEEKGGEGQEQTNTAQSDHGPTNPLDMPSQVCPPSANVMRRRIVYTLENLKGRVVYHHILPKLWDGVSNPVYTVSKTTKGRAPYKKRAKPVEKGIEKSGDDVPLLLSVETEEQQMRSQSKKDKDFNARNGITLGNVEQVVWKNDMLAVTRAMEEGMAERMSGCRVVLERYDEKEAGGASEPEWSSDDEDGDSSDSEEFKDNTKDDPDFMEDAASDGEMESSSSEEDDTSSERCFLDDMRRSVVSKKMANHIKVIKPPRSSDVKDYSKKECKMCLDPTALHDHYECASCHVQSYSIGSIKRHVQRLENYNPKICKKCGEEFRNNYALKRHQYLVHTFKAAEEVFKCSYKDCKFKSKLKSSLSKHEAKVHRNEKQVACTWEGCNKVFKSAYSLRIHTRIHTNSKPIVCYMCGFSCRQKASLNWHMKTKHPEEPFFSKKWRA